MAFTKDRAGEFASALRGSAWFDRAVGLGFVTHGLVHLVVAWLALRLALGEQAEASNGGALAEIASTGWGAVLVWAVAAGMAVLVLWCVFEAVLGPDPQPDSRAKRVWARTKPAGKAVVYAALGWSAASVALGARGGDGSRGAEETWTARLMSAPAGQALVVVVGLAVAVMGIVLAWRGWSERFVRDLEAGATSGSTGSTYVVFGKLGHIAKGAAFVVVGGLFVQAGLSHRSRDAGGLDDALRTVRDAPAGPYLLMAVAAGIAAYGLFDFVRARHGDH